ncbi:MAG: ABC transporter permease [Candidatus Moranbacteria bacterium]|nr:ABC transporter permease [Candidatus Moranbacteria bacterium]
MAKKPNKFELIIKPRKKWFDLNLKELWRYRELAFIFAWRDIKVRYKQTFLGIVWAILQPVLMVAIFSFFFGRLANITSDGVPYPIFAFVGIVFWNYFSISLSGASNTIIENENIIKKVYFPRLILPISSTLTPLIDLVIALVVLVAFMLYYGMLPALAGILLLPILFFISFLASSGLGLFLASINLKYRDVRYALPFFIQILMYLTPVIYPSSLLGEKYRWILALNPMTGVIETARSSFLGVTPINFQLLFVSLGISVVLFLFGVFKFKKTERFFADIA